MTESGSWRRFRPQLRVRPQIIVNGNDVLTFEDTVAWDIKMMNSIAGTSSGGLFNVYLEGPGHVAIITHGEPLVLPTPVTTDPNATVAWSADVSPNLKYDLNIKSFLGHSSGKSFQLHFAGENGVVVQPYEERQPGQGDAGSNSGGQGIGINDLI